MLWLVVLASHSSHADDSPTPLAEASALSAPQRRDSASLDATMKLWPESLRSGLLVSEAAPEGRALSEVCGACTFYHELYNGAPTCCDALWTSNGLDCAALFSDYGLDCAGCNCPGDPSPPPSPPSSPPSPPSLPSPPSPPPATA
eukprot:scaffold61701_cov69-Phaeocystis_antarctica.AAC.3